MSIKQVVVYGSNGGIGSAVVRKFFENNHNVCLFSKNETKLKEKIDRLKQNASRNQIISGCAVDVCDTSSIESSVRYLQQNQLPVSDLILCAGVNRDKLLMTETDSNINYIIQTNLISSFNLCKQYSKLMIKQNQQSSSIVLIGSVVGLMGNIGQSIYASSKSALIGLTKSLSKELNRKNIRVNLVVPGFIDTAMLNELNKESLAREIPLGRLGSGEDVANAVYFISTNRSINGQMLVVDGGLSLK